MPTRPVADEDHARAPRPRAHGDRVDRGGLELGEVDVAALGRRALEIGGERRRAAPGWWTTSTGSGTPSTAVAPVVKTATRAPSGTGSAGSGRSDERAARPAGVGRALGGEHEVGPQRAGTPRTARALPAPRMQTVRSTSTGGMHAPEPSNTIAPGLERRRQRGAGRHVRVERRAREARRPRAGSRPCARRRAPRPRGSRRRRAAALRDLEQLVERRRRLGHARLGRPAAAHADDHRVGAELAQQRRPSGRPRRSCRCACRSRSPPASARRSATGS